MSKRETALSDPGNFHLTDMDVEGDAFDDPAWRELLGLPPMDEPITAGMAHMFTCRTPLHHGPCKGWKRTSKSGHDFGPILGADTSVQRGMIRDLDDGSLTDLFAAASGRDTIDEPLIIMLGDEFDRRDNRTPSTDISAQQEADAANDVYRRPGETRREAIRRSYGEHIHLQAIQAEQSTRGHLLNPAGRNARIDPMTLFSGPSARARKWASEDLLRFWEDNPRVTFADFAGQYSGAARRKAAVRGNGRDFGV